MSNQSPRSNEPLFLSLAEIAFIFAFTILIQQGPPGTEVTVNCDLTEYLLVKREIVDERALFNHLRQVEKKCGTIIRAGVEDGDVEGTSSWATLTSLCGKYKDLLLANRSRYSQLSADERASVRAICGYDLVHGSLSSAIGTRACFSYQTENEHSPYGAYAMASIKQSYDQERGIMTVTFMDELKRERNWSLSDPVEMRARHQRYLQEFNRMQRKQEAQLSVITTGTGFDFSATGRNRAAFAQLLEYVDHVAEFAGQKGEQCAPYIQTVHIAEKYKGQPMYAFLNRYLERKLNFVQSQKSLE